MTTVTFESEGNRLVGFTVSGHSGLADAGEDILCAAVTSAVRLVECGINDILGLSAPVRLREEEAFLSLKLPAGLSDEIDQVCQTLLAAMMLHFVQLVEEYPENIIVMEV